MKSIKTLFENYSKKVVKMEEGEKEIIGITLCFAILMILVGIKFVESVVDILILLFFLG